MDFTMDDYFDFDAFNNWPVDPPHAHDAAGGQEGSQERSFPQSVSPIGWSMTQSSLENATFGDAQPPAEVVPGCSTNGPNEDTNQVTTALTPAQEGVGALSSGQASSSTNNIKKCACIVCLGIACQRSGDRDCRVQGCSHISVYYRREHEKCLYKQAPEIIGSAFDCPVENCCFSSKRWSDLCRHTTAKHCNNPAKFECSVIGCKHHGEGNGFIRKDKLMDHYKSMHRGEKVPGQVVRTLQPALASSHAEASGSGSIAALGK